MPPPGRTRGCLRFRRTGRRRQDRRSPRAPRRRWARRCATDHANRADNSRASTAAVRRRAWPASPRRSASRSPTRRDRRAAAAPRRGGRPLRRIRAHAPESLRRSGRARTSGAAAGARPGRAVGDGCRPVTLDTEALPDSPSIDPRATARQIERMDTPELRDATARRRPSCKARRKGGRGVGARRTHGNKHADHAERRREL